MKKPAKVKGDLLCLGAVLDVFQPVVGREDEETGLVEFRRADDGHGLGQQLLVGHVGVKVH